jgi:hypothetical protein
LFFGFLVERVLPNKTIATRKVKAAANARAVKEGNRSSAARKTAPVAIRMALRLDRFLFLSQIVTANSARC